MSLMSDFINENAGLDLQGYDFTSNDLRGTNFEGANLEGAIFVNSNLESVNMKGVNMKGATLSGANMKSVNLEGADLRSAELIGTVLRKANLRYCDLEGSNLEKVILNHANLRHANLSYSYGFQANFTGSNLKDCDMENICLRKAVLKNANLTRANLTNSNLEDANLTNADLTDANTTNMNIRGAMLDGAIHNIEGIETEKILSMLTFSSKAKPLEMIRKNDTFDIIYVYDFVEGEIKKKDVDDENVIFYIENQKQGISYPRRNLQDAYNDRSSIFVSCKNQSLNAVSVGNVKPNILYFRINLTVSVFVSINSIKDLLVSRHKEWYIRRTEVEEEFIASIEVVYDRDETNIFGDELNIVSRDHCQSGTAQKISILSPVEFILSGGKSKQSNRISVTRKCKKKKNCTKKRVCGVVCGE